MPLALSFAIVFVSGLVIGVFFSTRSRAALQKPALETSTTVTELTPGTGKPAPDDKPANVLLHDLRTPINMILGYCDVLLNPANAATRSLAALTREDVTSIARNARQLQALIDQLFADLAPAKAPLPTIMAVDDSPVADPPDLLKNGAVLVLHPELSVMTWFESHLAHAEFIYARSIDDLRQLPLNQRAVQLVITDGDESVIPEIVAQVGEQVPVVGGVFPDSQQAADSAKNIIYLPKPVTYQTLAVIIAAFANPIQTVLIIDDNQDNVEMIRRMLIDIHAGCQIWKAYTGREGLALVREQPPDLVIIDVLLPDISGVTIAHYLRTVPLLAAIPVILVSAQRDSDMPPLVNPTQLSLIRLGGFSVDDLDRLFKALTA